MITQRLVLADPPVGMTGLHFTDTKVWACAGCGATITGELGHLIAHPDDCPEMRDMMAADFRRRLGVATAALPGEDGTND